MGGGPLWRIILSVVGLDGYTSYAIPNYYILGEWFLGALILLYLLYPVLLYGLSKEPIATTVAVAAGYLWIAYSNPFQMNDFRNIFSCMASFYVGMLFVKYRDILDNHFVGACATAAALIVLNIPLPIQPYHLRHISGVLLFVAMWWIGKGIVRANISKRFLGFLGGISYEIFLLQNVVLDEMTRNFIYCGRKSYCLRLVASICVIVCLATLLHFVSKKVRRVSEK